MKKSETKDMQYTKNMVGYVDKGPWPIDPPCTGCAFIFRGYKPYVDEDGEEKIYRIPVICFGEQPAKAMPNLFKDQAVIVEGSFRTRLYRLDAKTGTVVTEFIATHLTIL